MKQIDIAEHLDLTQGAVSAWMNRLEVDWTMASMDEIRIAYIRALREQAAGRATNGDLDLATERAGLARAQREKIEMANAVTRGELAATAYIEEILTKTAARVAAIFDGIPGMCHRRLPNLTNDEIDLIAGEIAKARNTVATMSLADIDQAEDEDVDTAPLEVIS